MLHVPWMNQEIVHQQRYDCKKKCIVQYPWFNHIIHGMIYVKMRSRRKIMEHETETESQTQTQLPSQEERVRSCRAGNVWQAWYRRAENGFPFPKLKPSKVGTTISTASSWVPNEISSAEASKYQTYDYLTLQICISKDKLFCQERQDQSSENHQKVTSRMRHRKV